MRRIVERTGEYAFIAPMAVFLLVFVAYPVYLNVRISFQDLRAVTLLHGDLPWVGLAHYRTVLADPVVRQSFGHLLLFTAGSLLLQIPLGLALALLFGRSFPGAGWMRGSFLLAWAMPAVVVGAIFRWLLDSQFGVVNWVLRTAGLVPHNVSWLTDVHTVLPTLTAVNVWLGIPFNMALFAMALQALPREVLDAASVDGASAWQRFWHVTLPLLRPALVAALLLGVILTVRQFDLVWAMTQGGPFDASQLPSTLAYRRVFQQFRFGEGAAILNLLFLVLTAIAITYVWSIRREHLEWSIPGAGSIGAGAPAPGSAGSGPIAARSALGLAALLLFLFPVCWMVATSFKSGSEILTWPPHWVPSSLDWSAYRDRVLHDASFLGYLRNSAIVGMGTALLSLVLAAPAAYALARLRLRGRLAVLLLGMTALFFPGVMLALPLFVIFARLGLLDGYMALIVANAVLSLPVSLVILRIAFVSIPRESTEAALIDGCGRWSGFLRIALPQARSGLATAGVFAFLSGWNDLVFALSFTNRDTYRPVTAGIWRFVTNTRTDWGTAMAYATLAMAPTLIVFLFAQRFIASGLTSASVR